MNTLNQTNLAWKYFAQTNANKIENLRIQHSFLNLRNIDLSIFKRLTRVVIKNTTLTTLPKKIIQEIPLLETLLIKNNKLLRTVEESFLKEACHLKKLRIQGVNLNPFETQEFFRNLTMNSSNLKVTLLDWQNNNFRVFKKDFLTAFPKVKSLILTNSQIHSFEEGTFAMTNLEKIQINNNKLKSLPEKTFRTLLEKTSDVSLEENEILCDCKMKWMQKYILKHDRNEPRRYENLICLLQNKSIYLLKDFLLKCINGTTASSENESSSLNNKCSTHENKEVLQKYIQSTTSTVLYSVKKAEYKFKLQIKNEQPQKLHITLGNQIILDDSFLWLLNYTNSTFPVLRCIKPTQRYLILEVRPNTNYLVCLETKNELSEPSTNLYDCQPIKTQNLLQNQTWLTRKSIFLSIITIITLMSGSFGFGALIIYIWIRKNPSLIRNSKRVIVVKRQDKTHTLIMPRHYERLNQYDDASLKALKIFNCSLDTPRPSISYDTLSTASYVSAIQPTPFELLTYRINRLREIFEQDNRLPKNTEEQLQLQVSTYYKPRLPPNVDLLLEYELYTIATSITTTTTTTRV